MAGIPCAGFTFYNEFDSANLAKVEHVPGSAHDIASKHPKNALVQEIIDAEFNLWTKPDCYGTEFENGNRTWFYFGVKAPGPAMLVKFNIVDLNRQGKMYSQGMAPVYRIIPGKPRWERIFDKPTHCLNDDIFTLSFKFRTPDNVDSVVYFAFTYPFSVTELEKMLTNVDSKYLHVKHVADDDVYYVRETVCHSCDGKPIDLITISSYHGISKEREEKLKNLFNKSTVPRPYKFPGKKVSSLFYSTHYYVKPANRKPKSNLLLLLGHNFCRNCGTQLQHTPSKEEVQFEKVVVGAHGDINSNESGLFMYIDLHGHASKKGIFMYGNHFDDIERNVECMLLPKLMSMNNHNFHFHACNFTERNMYLKDKRDGMSRAGSGRVAVLSLTGIIKSYTLECNYNTGRLVNILPPTIREPHGRMHTIPVPPKYTPQIFEEVGRSLGASILDLTGNNPFTRLPNSEFHSLSGLRDWLRTMSRELNETRPKKGKIGGSLTQAKSTRTIFKNRTSIPKPIPKKPKSRSAPIPLDRKENLAQPSSSKSGIKVNKQPFKAKTRKELTLKSKNSTEKVKPINKGTKKPAGIEASNRSKGKLETSTQTTTPVPSEKNKEEGVHLREICFINNSEGKAVIAKYENNDKFDDSLVVAWEKNSTHPQLYTRKARVFSAPPYHLPNKSFSEPGTSKQGGGCFRVHNFAKTKARRNLRRLASAADILGKVDKKKKKKLKAK
uniref:Cytosolic carboxypeptidase-like protein 5 n=1 Tax=Diabrotica virgifera virgifera TaxID=50390 RepID=A0A6P7FUV6_DIAVI